MFKFVLAAMVSLLFVLSPVNAAKGKAEQGVTASKAKKHASSKARGKLVRRVVTVNGKRKVVYQRQRKDLVHRVPAPPRLSAGDLAGLNLTRDPLALQSSVAFVLDQNNSEVLFEKNANIALPIASLTKLMTGLIVVEAGQDMNQILTITDDDIDREKFTTSRLKIGARMTRASLLHIALMSSENRAASALARNYPGGLAGFVAAMNTKAHELGMRDTRYVDSSGLSSRNVASARDLATLVQAAYQQPLLREYSTDPKSIVDAGDRQMHYKNTNYLVTRPDWDIGLQKTGFINEAGRCLVMQTMIQGRAVIMVFLDSKGKLSRTADAGRIRRWLEALNPPTLVQGAG